MEKPITDHMYRRRPGSEIAWARQLKHALERGRAVVIHFHEEDQPCDEKCEKHEPN